MLKLIALVKTSLRRLERAFHLYRLGSAAFRAPWRAWLRFPRRLRAPCCAHVERGETIHAERSVMLLQLLEQDDGLVDGLDQIAGVARDELGRCGARARWRSASVPRGQGHPVEMGVEADEAHAADDADDAFKACGRACRAPAGCSLSSSTCLQAISSRAARWRRR